MGRTFGYARPGGKAKNGTLEVRGARLRRSSEQNMAHGGWPTRLVDRDGWRPHHPEGHRPRAHGDKQIPERNRAKPRHWRPRTSGQVQSRVFGLGVRAASGGTGIELRDRNEGAAFTRFRRRCMYSFFATSINDHNAASLMGWCAQSCPGCPWLLQNE